MSEQQEKYIPKVGDRVRATCVHEGTVYRVQEDDRVNNAHVGVGKDSGLRYELYDEDGWEFEKLADPEPVWVNGDVVKIPSTGGVFVRAGDAWRHAKTNQFTIGSSLSNQWNKGNLKVLYKADTPKIEDELEAGRNRRGDSHQY